MMKSFTSIAAAGLAFLLSPAAHAQSSVSPVWIQHAWTDLKYALVRPYGISWEGGNVVVTGHNTFDDGATFDSVHVTFDNSYGFAASYDALGQQQWVRATTFTPLNSTWASEVAAFDVATSQEDIYTLEGYSYLYDADMLTMGGVSINKYSADGTHQWMMPLFPPVADPGKQPGFALGLGIDGDGNLYTGGIYRDTLVLAPDTLAPFPLTSSVGDVFLASYEPDRRLRWSRRIGGPRHDVIAGWIDPHGAFAVDANGNVFIGGFFSAGAVFGEGQPAEVTFPEDAYALASFDSSGALQWVRTGGDLGVSENAGPWRLAVDASGNLFVDWFVLAEGGANQVTVGDTTFTDPGYGGEFLTKISPEGSILWARQIKSDGNEVVEQIAVDERGHVYVGGSFDGIYLRLENTELRKDDLQADREDGFIAHYRDDGRLLWAGHASGKGTQRVNAIAVSPAGDLYVAGEFNGTLRLGTKTLSAKTSGGLDMFVARYSASTITAAEPVPDLPESAIRLRNYPNPFHNRTAIEFNIASPGRVRLIVYDLLGREVALLADDNFAAGLHETVLNAGKLPSGLYVCRVETDYGSLSRAMLLTR